MALLHKAEIRPSKLELLSTWLPTQPWYPGPPAPEVTRVSAGRFDDPAGAVGIEIMLVRAGDGPVLHTPLTYRDAPLDGADDFLVGTTTHSVLGKRWVYDACGDPIFTTVLTNVIKTAGTQAQEEIHSDGQVTIRPPSLLLQGTGTPEAHGTLEIIRIPDTPATPGEATLTAHWSGVDTPLVLARLTP
ncbi:hypothetical protein BJY16_004069 [Actinoplanes octamycinicus]|uniref:Maltokinase N-terminal cap domain-containing protein n=1 Tax=Actinoplanes octamycinicus TaxID=135948 RepID=A0A7W7M896_9ACTN|nr:hypothetical protein [Actinoplanes octamycinicus]MBB4740610.1 hypothetical protein [Actinoplanes octamycinicus]GIE63088.1 hypothetical protein Aoc01nite_84900 [Actinoplanes octamycinicus]